MSAAAGAKLERAMRFAEHGKRMAKRAQRGRRCWSEPESRRTWRQVVNALYSALPPKADGTHPLDPDNLKLEKN